jgi:RNA polymerase sigma-70 factor (ECF subfamily)
LPGLAVSPILGDLNTIFPSASDLEIQMLTSLPSLLIIPFVLLSGKLSVGRDKLRNDGSLRGYLLRAVYRTALNVLRSKNYASSYRSQTKLQIEQQLCTYYDPDENEIIRNLYARQIADELDAVVETLSPKCREVFRMSHFEGLSNREISERLNISVSTVENHINNALRQLRGKLGHLKMFLLLTIYILGQ